MASNIGDFRTGVRTRIGDGDGRLSLLSIANPASPTVTPQGVAGATTYGYKIAAVSGDAYAAGLREFETAASPQGSTVTGNAVLSAGNFNRITWAAVTDAVKYNVYRTLGGATIGLVGTVSAPTLTFDDTGLVATTTTPAPTVNRTGDLDTCIDAAREQYSKDKPLEKAVRIQGDGGFKYAIASLTGFDEAYSSVKRVAYPHVTTDQLLPWLDSDRFTLERTDAGLYLWFKSATPSATEYFLVVFTAPHTISSSTSTVPPGDDEAVKDLAASFACEKLAATFAQTTDGTIQADSADRKSRVDYYRGLAKDYRASYERSLGFAGSRPVSAGMAVVDLNPPFSARTRERLLFHD